MSTILVRVKEIKPCDDADKIGSSLSRILQWCIDISITVVSILIDADDQMSTMLLYYDGDEEKEYIKHCFLPSDILRE
jgi:hypothetical protein